MRSGSASLFRTGDAPLCCPSYGGNVRAHHGNDSDNSACAGVRHGSYAHVSSAMSPLVDNVMPSANARCFKRHGDT